MRIRTTLQVCFCGLLMLGGTVVPGCVVSPFDARFERSDDPDIFGTLIDDRGAFEFNRNAQTGELQRVDTADGAIFLATGGQDLGVERPDGSSLTIAPEGQDDVVVAVRNDPVIGSVDLQVDRQTLGDLQGVVRPNARVIRQLAGCQDNQAFVDGGCDIINNADLEQVVEDLITDLEAQGQTPPPAAVLTALLNRYFGIVLDCCLAWDEYRSNGGDACAGL